MDKTERSSIVDFNQVVEKSKYFNGAEIEESVKEAMFIAYDENPDAKEITLKHFCRTSVKMKQLKYGNAL